MPKIIENLDQVIVQKSLELFKKYSYQKVCMRTIAEEAGIAVGTLYNYFPTKWDLYISVFEESWKETYGDLKEETDKAEKDYINQFFTILYQDMKQKKGIVKELFFFFLNNSELTSYEQKEKIKQVRFPDIMMKDIYQLFLCNFKKEYEVDIDDREEDLNRMFTMVYTYIPLLQKTHDSDEDNIKFINDTVNSYLESSLIKDCEKN